MPFSPAERGLERLRGHLARRHSLKQKCGALRVVQFLPLARRAMWKDGRCLARTLLAAPFGPSAMCFLGTAPCLGCAVPLPRRSRPCPGDGASHLNPGSAAASRPYQFGTTGDARRSPQISAKRLATARTLSSIGHSKPHSMASCA